MEKLSLKDRKLLYWLDQDSRQTNKALAKKVGLSERGLAYKLARLERKGIIKRYVTFINTVALDYSHYKVLLKLQNTSIEQEDALLKRIVDDPNVRWAATSEGRWDLNFSIVARSSEDFVAIYQRIEQDANGAIAEKMVHLVVKAPGFTKGYLLKENSMSIRAYGAKDVPKLDDLDRRLLKAISQHARKSLVDLSKELDVSIDVVRYRLKRLEEGGVISGYTIMIDHAKLGIKWTAAYFSMNGMTPEVEARMYAFAQVHNVFAFIVTMIGTYDFSLEFEAPIDTGIEQTLRAFRKEFGEHIKEYELIPNTREHKYDFYPFG